MNSCSTTAPDLPMLYELVRPMTPREVPELVDIVEACPLLQGRTLLRTIFQRRAGVRRVKALAAMPRSNDHPYVVAERHWLTKHIRVIDQLNEPSLTGALVALKCLDPCTVIPACIVDIEAFAAVSNLQDKVGVRICRVNVLDVELLVGPTPVRPKHGECVGCGPPRRRDIYHHPGVVVDDFERLGRVGGGIWCDQTESRSGAQSATSAGQSVSS